MSDNMYTYNPFYRTLHAMHSACYVCTVQYCYCMSAHCACKAWYCCTNYIRLSSAGIVSRQILSIL